MTGLATVPSTPRSTVQGPTGERRLDSRASDAIALALRVDAPVVASEDVLDEAGAILSVVADEDAVNEEMIDAEVARFRTLLDDLDPAQLAEHNPTEPPTDREPNEHHDRGAQDDDPPDPPRP